MAEAAAPADRVRYRFGPLERRGLVAGWRGGQVAAVSVGLLLAVLALRTRPSAAGVLVALLFVGAGVAVAFWPVAGRTLEQWLPTAVRWTASGLLARRRWISPAPALGHLPAGDPPWRPAGWQGWAVFDGVRLEALAIGSGRSREVGILVDERARTATVVLAVHGHSFALLAPDDQDRRVAAWSRALASLAREGSGVHRLQWVESCLPDGGDAVRRHFRDHALPGAAPSTVASYGALVEGTGSSTRRHRVLVALSVRARGGAGAGRARRAPVPSETLLREVHGLEQLLAAADVEVEGALAPAPLAAVLREPMATVAALEGGPSRPAADAGIPGPGSVWPMAMEPAWDAVRTDGTWHATYWIAEWPRTPVTPDFLGPLLFVPVRRTLAMVMEPVSPLEAARQVARARTADLADGELRHRGGFLVTARQRREREGVELRDEELADGHAQFRFSGYVTVTADGRDELADACAAVEQAAGQARLEVRRLYGEQDRAFTCTLPLGRGLA